MLRRRYRRRWVHAPVIHAMLTIKKELHGLLFQCIHVVPFPIIMVLRWAALRAAEVSL